MQKVCNLPAKECVPLQECVSSTQSVAKGLMMSINYFDEIFVKCPKCHTENMMFPRNKKHIKCYRCGRKIKDKQYRRPLQKLYKGNKSE